MAIRADRPASAAEIGVALKAGRNCGSCIPELKEILRDIHVFALLTATSGFGRPRMTVFGGKRRGSQETDCIDRSIRLRPTGRVSLTT